MKENGRATAGYVRISSDKQDTARQEKRIAATGLPITLWFRDDTGKNPRDLAHKRPAFQAMLKAVEADLIGTIVIDRQDRFGTSDAYQWCKFIDLLREHGTTLVDADGKELSSTDDVTILTGTLGAITSTREQKEKGHRNVSGKLLHAAKGEYPGGYCPWGTDVVCFGQDGKEKWRTVYVGHFKRWKVYPDGRRERFDGKDNAPRKDPTDTLRIRPSIEKDRVKWVKQIFVWYATEAISPKVIADRLNALKVDPIFGEAWHKVTIKALLRNPAYIGAPALNKVGQGRFAEYVNGHVQEVARTNGRAKAGRRRKTADFIQPEKPDFKPMVPLDIWAKVQAKIEVASAEQAKRLRRPPNTESLWLKPFLICGKCGKPMRATRGDSTPYLSESYFCGTYGTYGNKNPTGCRCHRVQHVVLERVIADYLQATAPNVAQLLEATETGDMELARPLLLAWAGTKNEQGDVFNEVRDFIEEHVSDDFPRKGRDLEEVYGLLYERVRPGIEKAIQVKEKELDRMVAEFRGLSEKVRPRANVQMEALQAEIDTLRRKIADLRIPWSNLQAELRGRHAAYEKAQKVLSQVGNGRRKTETLKNVLDRIVCHFRYTGRDGKPTLKKSFLDSVEIVPANGQTVTLRMDVSPGPG
jgi:DNA invertase Pin-like site-specific DNA recombinase